METTTVVLPAPPPGATSVIAPAARAAATVVAPGPPATRTVITPGPRPAQASDAAYVHNQATAAARWEITHRLRFTPNVTVVDSAGSVVIGAITYTAPGQIALDFSAAFSGTAYLS